ncbi:MULTISPECIES: hypothetical protein [Brevibacillus]|uniref:hypothetical protein n=1 Tax=Brevibacillus TaxID=55080 RepID=UPI000D0FB117|nr:MULTISPECIES: hypothetical protein [Brevibacillus]PSJ71125.1 hypothetical protein C7J99_00960 [Brevibacillus brevis]RED28723.1 hypothetical protein DES34_10772 [Brevibacillus brevis]TQK62169.1 hypothetical protein FB479_106253 [Brevibacillus sp. AG162]VEF91682.1 Uncharacterised protein [Brevibacillus brevis]GEC89727.1 hypothetical protein BBR01nite_20580 [Brevibacillus brevis]
MKVVNTPQVQAQIERHKRFLERTELYNYPAYVNGEYYYHVAYWKWGKKDAVGYLVLRPDGEVVRRNEAEPVVKLFLVHAHAGRKIKNNLAIDKEKPIEMYQQKYEHLKALLPSYHDKMDAVIRQDVEKLIDVCETMIKSRDQLRAIHARGMDLLNQFFARNYVIEGEETALRDVLFESDYILYDRIRKQVLIKDSVDRLYQFFQPNRVELDRVQEQKRKKLHDLLLAYKDKTLRNIADESVKSFETHTIGKHESFHSVEQLREAHESLNKTILENGLMDKLRNP